MKILVIGDSCTDIFIYGEIDRISPEAPVPVFKPMRKTENGGMAKNVVANLEALGCKVHLVSNTNGIKKVRYVDERSNQMVMRVDDHDWCNRIDQNELISFDGYDAIIISDYCKGFLNEDDIQYICEEYNNVFIDTKKQLGDWVKNAKFIKINDLEHKKNFEVIPNYVKSNDIASAITFAQECTTKVVQKHGVSTV